MNESELAVRFFVVLDPFAGLGTGLAVAKKLGRKAEVANAFLETKARRFLWEE